MFNFYSLPFTVNRLTVSRLTVSRSTFSSRSAGPAGRAGGLLGPVLTMRAEKVMGSAGFLRAAGPVFFRSISAERVNVDSNRTSAGPVISICTRAVGGSVKC
ncbi:hypothetical protein AKJ40_01645 [candidate division MSBL1 archaeon SCGC-AAA259M10]|uniref:Uncharacterized protein n=1 Tax=candidate division MSBL1 archaeon SCGC-AAA259M10 TaxID=1698270 RepID=A0A133V1D8_9EURY|nr:hypothetical protein AKJ40_01645 [candidate division MSBL1 archaeon SCGC-AAA259M10]